MRNDVAIIGGGPSGSAFAALCAQAGKRVLLVERTVFPRDKVCGDCLNPACWPVLEELGVAERVRGLPHAALEEVAFVSARGHALRIPLPRSLRGEIAVPRRLLDAVLLDRARELGVTVQEGTALTALAAGWQITTTRGTFSARTLIAADGRNSTVARLLGLLPAAAKDRVGLQTHVSAPAGFGERVEMHFLPQGYGGVAAIGGGQLNVCLVAAPVQLAELKAWAAARFDLAADHAWRTIAPLARDAVPPAQEGLLLVGDAARVVEPFTGEGIYYALASGALAARHVIADDLPGYAATHARLYRGRLWVNELAKAAVLHPRLAATALEIARFFPGVLRHLTRRVVGGAEPVSAPPVPTAAAQI
jgi:menaquinone-9 beta-reductase